MQHLATRAPAELLREGVAASKDGKTTLARELFLQAAAEDPSDESAWICLASITDSIHLRISYIHRALEINPDNTRAKLLLEASRKKLAGSLVEKAKESVKTGDQINAAHYLLAATEFDSSNDDAWIGLACLNGSVEDRELILRQALQKNPFNERLRSMLRTMERNAPQASRNHTPHAEPRVEAPVPPVAPRPAEPIAVEHAPEASGNHDPHVDAPVEHPVEYSVEDSVEAPIPPVATRPAEPVVEAAPAPQPLTLELADKPEDKPEAPPTTLEILEEGTALEMDSYPALPPSLDTDVQIEVIEDDASTADDVTDVGAAEFESLEGLEVETLSVEAPTEEPAEAPVEMPPPEPAVAQNEIGRLTLEPSPEPVAEPVAEQQQPAPRNEQDETEPPPIPDGCPLCMEALTGTPERCPSCGGRLKLWDPRVDSKDFAAVRVDQRKMLLAVNRCSVTLRNDPQNSQLHYALGLAYLNLNRLDVALRCLKRSEELNPSAELKAMLDRLSKAPSTLPLQPAVPESPRPLLPDTLPAAPKVDDSKPAVPAKSAQTGQWGAGKRDKDPKGGKTVLIVDDSPTIRRVVSLTLERQGYQVVTAIDGVDGLTKLQENRVDLVLLDIMMPKLDGYQVCKTIREKKKSIPVIMLSGKDGFFDKVRGKMAGSTAYMTKPFEQDTLLNMVKEHCALP